MSKIFDMAREAAAGHAADCGCFYCCLLVGAGEKRAAGEMAEIQEAINWAWNAEIDRCMAEVAWFGGPGFGGYWYCAGCGNPQLGDPPWGKVFEVRDRCRPCGPGKGYVACPATHGRERCGLCRGEGWVEELV